MTHKLSGFDGDTSASANTEPLRELAKDGINTDTTLSDVLDELYAFGYQDGVSGEHHAVHKQDALQALTTKMEQRAIEELNNLRYNSALQTGIPVLEWANFEKVLTDRIAELQAHHKQEDYDAVTS